MPTNRNLGELASLIRSKNAGPFLLTFDVMFDDYAAFKLASDNNVITAEVIARLYGLAPDDVRIVVYEPGLAIKATIPRRTPSGDFGDTDIYGAQQHAPLIQLPVERQA